jgi:hypothetical protein
MPRGNRFEESEMHRERSSERILVVRRIFEPGRIAQAVLEEAYERLVPSGVWIVRKSSVETGQGNMAEPEVEETWHETAASRALCTGVE